MTLLVFFFDQIYLESMKSSPESACLKLEMEAVASFCCPQVGGCSLVADLSKFVNRSDIWSSQVCYSASQLGTFEKPLGPRKGETTDIL